MEIIKEECLNIFKKFLIIYQCGGKFIQTYKGEEIKTRLQEINKILHIHSQYCFKECNSLYL
jgi:hypothetical protein